MLIAYRANVIADPASHEDHVAAAHALLTRPSMDEVAATVRTLPPDALRLIRDAVEGRIRYGAITDLTAPASIDEPDAVEIRTEPYTVEASSPTTPALFRHVLPAPTSTPLPNDDEPSGIHDFATTRRRW